ncbi:MAG: hypothetical protein JW779_13095 [Candidatus Thorarchaeota archaeon]|nr:hypothetical protein [Candidatus Thorarchaeota archaeon]
MVIDEPEPIGPQIGLELWIQLISSLYILFPLQTLLLWTARTLFTMGEILYASAMAGLYGIGIIQLVLFWLMYRKRGKAILMSYVAAIFGLVLSIIVSIYWSLGGSSWITVYFIPIIPIEIALLIFLFKTT